MSLRLPAFLLASLVILPLSAATRMTYDINGTPTPIEWDRPAFPLKYEIESRVAQANPKATAMVDQAFAAWAAIADADVSFRSGGVVANVMPQATNRISVSLADDLFENQGAAAVTSYSYDTKTGRMLDADITIDKALFDGNVNAQVALQHEIGHVLGLDHSAVLASIMYPYVSAGIEPATFE
ncbi:MAG TPA: matrixin family metalloprotease, partial [Thermoanaerobaculia bacterium]|nr:matrixin family metalloprotease [Thermoanaerobaculia bacterium]